MRITPGSRIGRYRIDELIGTGDTGDVYRAFDGRLERRVMVNLLTLDGRRSEEHFIGFAQEARATAIINHPNIVTVFDVGQHEGRPFVVSEFLEGETLRVRLATDGLPAVSAINYARQIAEGLLAAHRLNIVHCDLKPENVFITFDGRVKILDFGLAKWREEAIARLQDPSITTPPETLIGAVGYMSPEQVRGYAVDERSDLFSLGAILYEMIAGTPAFHAETPIETLGAILDDDPPSLRGRNGVTLELEHVIRHSLEKDRGMRFQSARDLLFALELAAAASRPRRVPLTSSRQNTLAWLPVPVASLFRLL
jgi:eukaryotic-like serine/threonine-protein kinase